MSHSKLATQLRLESEAAMRAMSPAARLELAFELGARGLEMYMRVHGVDRTTAARALERAGRAGRRYSRCMDDDGRDRQ